MHNTYREQLQYEYDSTVEAFEKAKKEAMKELEQLDVYRAMDYGAGYATHIDKISVAAGKVTALASQIRAYDYFASPEKEA